RPPSARRAPRAGGNELATAAGSPLDQPLEELRIEHRAQRVMYRLQLELPKGSVDARDARARQPLGQPRVLHRCAVLDLTEVEEHVAAVCVELDVQAALTQLLAVPDVFEPGNPVAEQQE